jgi:hypothetical protein
MSTDAGMQIDLSNEQQLNVHRAISATLEGVSNVILTSEEQDLKQHSPMISTDAGMQIDWSEKQDHLNRFG